MVDSAWLAYEEPLVIQDVLRRMGAEESIALTFVSVTYQDTTGGASLHER